MSGGKVALFAVSAAAMGIVYLVHYQQERDKREMHKGVIKDKERLEMKRQQKMQALQTSDTKPRS